LDLQEMGVWVWTELRWFMLRTGGGHL
jgi:hypothetical protein